MISRPVLTRKRLELGLVAVGLLVSAYLTAVHYSQGAVPLACGQGPVINCDAVTTSAWSRIGPFPVAALGLLWFVATLALVLIPEKPRTLSLWSIPAHVAAKLAWTLLGLLFVFYLVYAELFLIGAICLWCTVVHIDVVALFLVELAAYVDQTSPL